MKFLKPSLVAGILLAALVLTFQNCSPFQSSILAGRVPSSLLLGAQNSGTLQGRRMKADGSDFTQSTISIRQSDLSAYANSFGWGSSAYTSNLAAGTYEVGVQVPQGYDVFYSICNDCISHPDSSYQAYGGYFGTTLTLDVHAGHYIDLYFKFVPNSSAVESDLSESLSCNFAGTDVPPTTDSATFAGDVASVQVGLSSAFGGIATQFALIDNSSKAVLNILEARSAAGASWQNAFMMLDANTNRIIVANQAAGNMALQWGFGDTYSDFKQNNWNPIFSDHYHPNADFSAAQVNTSPCFHTGYRTFDGKLAIAHSTPTSSGSKTVALQNSYTLRASMNQGWSWFASEQAFYLNRQAAHAGNLRVYLALQGGGIEGPLAIADAFNVVNKIDGSCSGGVCNFHTSNLKYAVLVWNVGGHDIGMVVHKAGGAIFQAQVAQNPIVFCSNSSDDSCGNLEWHTYTRDSRGTNQSVSLSQGQQFVLETSYEIGSLSQLSAMGYPIVAASVAGSGGGSVSSLPGAPSQSGSVAATPTPTPAPVVVPPIPAGFFSLSGGQTIYYSNGNDAFCHKQSWDDFLNSGGASDKSNVQIVANLPAQQRNDGDCALVPVPEGWFQVNNTGGIYYSNGNNAFCQVPTWEKFLSSGGRADKSNVHQLTQGLPPNMRNDGMCK